MAVLSVRLTAGNIILVRCTVWRQIALLLIMAAPSMPCSLLQTNRTDAKFWILVHAVTVMKPVIEASRSPL